MAEPLRVGIAGCGVVGKRRRHHRQARQHARGRRDQVFEVTALSDGARCYRHYSGVLNEGLDVLFVCLPNDLAAEVTVAGLEKARTSLRKPPGATSPMSPASSPAPEFPTLKLKYGFNHRHHDRCATRWPSCVPARSAASSTCAASLRQVGDHPARPPTGGTGAPRWRRHPARPGIHMVDLMRLFAGDFTDIHSFVSSAFGITTSRTTLRLDADPRRRRRHAALGHLGATASA